MAISQFGPETDEVLNQLSTDIGEHKEAIEKHTKLHDEAWEKVLATFDEFTREGKAARFICKDGTYLYKRPYQAAPRLNEEMLKQKLNKRQLAAITEPKINSALLEAAVQRGLIKANVVADCIVTPEPSFSRIHSQWTKDDAAIAEIIYKENDEPEVSSNNL